MPVRYRVLAESELLTTWMDGRVSLGQILSICRQQMVDRSCRETRKHLMDLRAVDFEGSSLDILQALAEITSESAVINSSNGHRTACIIDELVYFRMKKVPLARIDFNALAGSPFQVFKDVHSACLWLDVDPAIITEAA